MAPPTGVQKAAEEIALSERHFVEDMRVLRDTFGKPLRAWTVALVGGNCTADDVAHPAELKGLVERLLLPLEAVVTFAETFLRDLRAVENRGTWREVFERHEGTMSKAYGRYVAAYNAVWSELSRYRQQSRAVDAFLKCAELQPGNVRQQTFASLCIMPVQRGPRYVLLLDELRKRASKAGYAWEYGDNNEALEAALECAKRAAKAIDYEISAQEERKASLRRVSGFFQKSEIAASWTLASCARQVLIDACLSRAVKKGQMECYLTLFDDALAFGDAINSKKKHSEGTPTEKKYVLREELDLMTLFAARGDDQSGGLSTAGVALDPWEFMVVSASCDPMVFSTPTPTAASEWVTMLTRAAETKRRTADDHSKPNKFVSAFVWRSGRVVTGDFEILAHTSGAFYVARPKGAQSATPGVRPASLAGNLLFPKQQRPLGPVFAVNLAVGDKGLGLNLRNDGGAVVVQGVAPDAPAAGSDVAPGDHLIKVADIFVYTAADVADAVRLAGNNVSIVLRRPQDDSDDGLPRLASSSSVSGGKDDGLPHCVESAAPLAPPPPLPELPPPTPPPKPLNSFDTAITPDYDKPPPPPQHPPPLPAQHHFERRSSSASSILADNPHAANVESMGFKRADIAKAVFAGANDVNEIINWIVENPQPDNPPPAPPTPAKPAPPLPTYEANPFR